MTVKHYHIAACAVSVLPACLFLILMAVLFGVDVPYLDQWELVPLLEKVGEGTWHVGDFWAQHNEHRILFPRLLMLVLAMLTRWNIFAELASNIVLGFLIFLLMAAQARQSTQFSSGSHAGWVPLTALIYFSLSQWQNWFLGWQMQVFLSLFAASAAMFLLARRVLGWSAFFVAAFMAVVATYSFANGMLVWGIGAGILALRKAGDGVALTRPAAWVTRTRLALWILLGFIIALSYFHAYQTPGYHGSPWTSLHSPQTFLSYMLVYLGQPAVNWNVAGAGIAGGIILLVWMGSTIICWRTSPEKRLAVLPFLALGLYAVGSAALTAVARSGAEGMTQALSSRYATLANPLWFAAVIVLGEVLHTDALPITSRVAVRLRCGLGILLAALLMSASAYGAYRWTERYAVYTRARAELVSGEDRGHLHYLYPDRAVLMERRAILRDMSYSVFRGQAVPAP